MVLFSWGFRLGWKLLCCLIFIQYKLIFLEELDLDTILGELLELENQLSSREGADQLFLGLPTLPTSTSHSSQLNQAATSTPGYDYRLCDA